MGHHRHNAENLRLRNFRRENPPQALKKGLLQMAELVYRPVIGAARTLFKALDLKIDTQGSEHIPKTGGAVLVSNHISYLDFIFTGLGALPQKRLVRFMAKESVFRARSPVR
ncbi:1-acyl-sn-glycerol-3-phosphate acyltransferase OS=Streptomyces microflavus OX=1919 GN=Smic_03060 PE=4 SV=1 [Streptomyces microflavus]